MKRTKRQEQSIILQFWLFFLLFILLATTVISNLLPRLLGIEWMKTEVQWKIETLQDIEKNGVPFKEMKKISAKFVEWKPYKKTILDNADEEFYKKRFSNTESESYLDFLTNLEREINTPENKEQLKKQTKRIENILPSYVTEVSQESVEALTDFKFVNYVESILQTFNLKHSSTIWVSNLTVVEDFSSDIKKSTSLENNIFYIPLSFDLEWRKEDILNFLYYIENVGRIERKWGGYIIFKDPKFSKNGNQIMFLWMDYNRNLFEHQIVDIESISFEEYFDDLGYTGNTKDELVTRVKNTQGSEEFALSINLRFYVKGIPNYKIEEAVKEAISEHNRLTVELNKLLAKKGISIDKKINLEKTHSYLKETKKSIQEINKSFVKKEKFDEIYKEAVHFLGVFKRIKAKIPELDNQKLQTIK